VRRRLPPLDSSPSSVSYRHHHRRSGLRASSMASTTCLSLSLFASSAAPSDAGPRRSSFASSSSSSSSSKRNEKLPARALREDWRQKSKPIPPGAVYPAKDHCSRCGLCDTYYVAHVKTACAFLGDGMSRVEDLEPLVHGRGRKESMDEMYFGVHDQLLYARKTQPIQGTILASVPLVDSSSPPPLPPLPVPNLATCISARKGGKTYAVYHMVYLKKPKPHAPVWQCRM